MQEVGEPTAVACAIFMPKQEVLCDGPHHLVTRAQVPMQQGTLLIPLSSVLLAVHGLQGLEDRVRPPVLLPQLEVVLRQVLCHLVAPEVLDGGDGLQNAAWT